MIGALDRGGAERHLLRILPALRSDFGWQVSIYCLGSPGELAHEFEEAGINIILPPIQADGSRHMMLYRILRMGLASLKLWWLLLTHRPAIVHFFLPMAYLVGAPVAILAGRRRLVMSRRSLNLYQKMILGSVYAEHFFHNKMSAVLGNSHAVIKELAAEGVSQEKLRLLYNGIDLPAASSSWEDMRKSLNLDLNSIVFINVSNLIPYKGHADLIAALAAVSSYLPDGWRFLMVGRDDGIGDELKQQAEKFNLTKNVVWLGMRDDVLNLMVAADIGVLCSWEEGFSNSILEGMAAGLPMVVTDVGGNAEAVIEGKSGVVVSAHDPVALGKALVSLASDMKLCKRLGSNARERVKEKFQIDGCVKKYNQVYVSLLENKKLPELDESLFDEYSN